MGLDSTLPFASLTLSPFEPVFVMSGPVNVRRRLLPSLTLLLGDREAVFIEDLIEKQYKLLLVDLVFVQLLLFKVR